MTLGKEHLTEADKLKAIGRSVYLKIDLDAVAENVACVRRKVTNKKAVICAMVKGNAYGHGAVEISRHLKHAGVERLGVATVGEGIQLRRAGIKGAIHLMGNVQPYEMEKCFEFRLVATVSTTAAIEAMAEVLNNRKDLGQVDTISMEDGSPQPGTVHIKVDTGMSRNGCQPEELPQLIQMCEELNVPLEGIYTHFGDFENTEFAKSQMDTFYTAIKPYRSQNLMFHMANSGGVLCGYGTELDMVRPGICIYGLPPGDDLEGFKNLGFRPIATLQGAPTLVKELPAGRCVGYGCTYIVPEGGEYVATLPMGYGDGYFRSLSNKGVITRDRTGEQCQIVGRVSMDAVTFRLSEKPDDNETFTLISPDFAAANSATAIADIVGTINYEVTTRLAPRVPRMYVSCGRETIIESLC